MGTWHGTCGLSRLPIRPTDRVYALFLTPSPYINTGMVTEGRGSSINEHTAKYAVPEVTPEEKDACRKTQVPLYLLTRARNHLTPQAGLGSQAENWDDHEILVRATAVYIRENR